MVSSRNLVEAVRDALSRWQANSFSEDDARHLAFTASESRGEYRAAAVLALLAGESLEDARILLIRRPPHTAERPDSHGGQIALPGGMAEEAETPVETALRETFEEVGVASHSVTLVGELPELPTLSTGFRITPLVGVFSGEWVEGEIPLRPDPHEVHETFWISLRDLMAPGIYERKDFRFGDLAVPNHVFRVTEPPVWGATGAILFDLLRRLGYSK